MRLLIHYVGDISQPLHTLTRITEQFPKGDYGGNLFNISSPVGFKDVKELHALWDTAIYKQYKIDHIPFSEPDWEQFM